MEYQEEARRQSGLFAALVAHEDTLRCEVRKDVALDEDALATSDVSARGSDGSLGVLVAVNAQF